MHSKKDKILVFPCGSEIGMEIAKSLMWDRHIDLYGGSSVFSNHGKYVYKNYIEGVPFVNDSDFISSLNKIIDKYCIDFIFPAHDDVVLKLSENASKLHCKVIGSSFETCKVCRSKRSTYDFFKDKLRVPKVFKVGESSIKFPVFLKPDKGQGTKGTFIANDKKDIEFYTSKDDSLLILEYLPGREYTIDCFTDRHEKLRFVGSRERIRIMNGISVDTKPIFDDRFNKIADIINENLKFRGVWFFQLKEDKNNELTLLEIAPRVAGAMGLYRNLGVNLPLLSLYDALDIDVDIICNNFLIEMDRALYARFDLGLKYDHVYIDLEDCLILDGKINTLLIAFLYQCLNKGIEIHLLTRYGGDINNIFAKYKLSLIFDSMTQIDSNEPKSKYIKNKYAIFIDDSFAERKDVHDKLGIPVFGLESLECLINSI